MLFRLVVALVLLATPTLAQLGVVDPSILKQVGATTGQCLIWDGTKWSPDDCAVGLTDTDDLSEGATNLYFTNTRARAAISAGANMSYDSGTGIMSLVSSVTAGAGAIPKGDASPGRLDISWLASGTPDGSKFVRDDRTLAQVAFSQLTGAAIDDQIPDTITRDSEWDTLAEIETATGYDFSDAGNLTGNVPAARMQTNWGAAGTNACDTSGGVLYDNGSAVGCSANLTYDGTNVTSLSNVKIGQAGAPTTSLHVVLSGTGEGTPTSGSGEVIRAQRNQNSAAAASISIIAGSAAVAGVNFGDNSNINAGRLRFDHATDEFYFDINLTEGLRITANGLRFNGSATSGNVLRGNGTDFVSAQLNYSDLAGTVPEANDLETDGAAGIASGEVFIGTGAGTGNYAAISGDATLANNGALTLAAGSVSAAELDEAGVEAALEAVLDLADLQGDLTEDRISDLAHTVDTTKTIEDEGTPLTTRATMNFTGDGVSLSDAGGKTVVTIPGGGGGSGTEVMTADFAVPAGLSSYVYSRYIPADGTLTLVRCFAPAGVTFDIQLVQRGGSDVDTFAELQECGATPANFTLFDDSSFTEGEDLLLEISNVTGSPDDGDQLYVYVQATTPGGTVADDAIDTDKLNDGANTPVVGDCLIVDSDGLEIDYANCLISGDPTIIDTTSAQTLEAKLLNSPALVDDTPLSRVIPNDASTGTTVNHLVKIQNDSGEEAVIATTSDTDGIVGVAMEGAGTTGSVKVAKLGEAQLDMDGACTLNDWVIASTSVNGEGSCTSTWPTGVQVIGRATQTTGAAGLADVELFPYVKDTQTANAVTAGSTLTTDAPVLGNANDRTVKVGSRSGNTTEFGTVTGPKTTGKQVEFDADGNLKASATDIGSGGGSDTALYQIATNFGNPADGATYEWGCNAIRPFNSNLWQAVRCPIAKTGTVTAVYLDFYGTGLGSSETATISLRLNNSSDTTLSSTVAFSSGTPAVEATGLSISVTAGDFFTIKGVMPTFATDPANFLVTGTVVVEY